MNAIKLTTKQAKPIVKAAFPDYTGRKFRIEFTDKVRLHDTNWDGGSRNYYQFVTPDGESHGLPNFAPWDNPIEGNTFETRPDVLVVEHCFFCGHDLGITIYAHPSYAPKWLTSGQA